MDTQDNTRVLMQEYNEAVGAFFEASSEPETSRDDNWTQRLTDLAANAMAAQKKLHDTPVSLASNEWDDVVTNTVDMATILEAHKIKLPGLTA